MARASGLYSRVIAWLKILLPLVALILLSTMFLLSQRTDPESSVPFADALGRGETAQQQVGSPYFAGTTQRGDMITMTAKSARPDGSDKIHAEDVSANLIMSDGSRISLDSVEATMRNELNAIQLEGGVIIKSTTGYTLVTDALISGTDRIEVETLGPVEGDAPAGRFSAGKMQIDARGENGDIHLLFTGGVKLVYEPGN